MPIYRFLGRFGVYVHKEAFLGMLFLYSSLITEMVLRQF